MENPLSKYVNRELKDIISTVTVVQGVAKDSGQPYYAIQLSFINGYSKRLFLKDDERFAWVNAMELIETNQQVESF